MPDQKLPLVKRLDELEEQVTFLLDTVSLSRVVESPTGPTQVQATLREIFESWKNKKESKVDDEPQAAVAGISGNQPSTAGPPEPEDPTRHPDGDGGHTSEEGRPL